MKLLLVLSLLVGQTIYEWVDKQGESHFTNDPSSIPAGAKRRVTEGAELMITSSGKSDSGVARSVVDAGVVPAAAPAPDSCAAARLLISQLEAQREQEKAGVNQEQEQEAARCQQLLRTHGQAEFARCTAGVGKAPSRSKSGSIEKHLESAREMLRRAQVDGCR